MKEPAPRYRLRVLGPLDLRTGDDQELDRPLQQPKRLALLVYLALAPGRFSRRDTLLALFWPDADTAHARSALSRAVYVLREVLGKGVLVSRGDDEIGLARDVLGCDAVAFVESLERGDLEAAVALYRGSLLEGFYVRDLPDFERWLEEKRRDLADRFVEALEALARQATERGDTRSAVRWWKRLAAVDPYRGSFALGLMRALAADDDRAGAIEHARRHGERLRVDLEAEPDAAVTALARNLARDTGPLESIAVLPFDNLGDERDEAFVLGVSEEIIQKLSTVASFRVTSRTSAAAYRGNPTTASKVARELGVDTVVEGSVRRYGERVRVTLRAVDGASDRLVWSGEYDRAAGDLFDIQVELGMDVARALRANLVPDLRHRIARPPTNNVAAYNLYLKARFLWSRGTPESLRTSLEYYAGAIAADPAFGLARAGLAEARLFLGLWHRPACETYPLVRSLVVEALASDPDVAEAHTLLGHVRAHYDHEWVAAEEHFQRALELNPSSSSGRMWYGLYLSLLGRHDEAMVQGAAAFDLDPLCSYVLVNGAGCFFFAGRYDEARQRFRRSLEVAPDDWVAHWAMGELLLAEGRHDEAIEAFRRSVDLCGFPDPLAALGYALARSGRRNDAREVLHRLSAIPASIHVGPYPFASVYLGLGEYDRAFECLEDAVRQRDWRLWSLLVFPRFNELRPDPRYETVMRAMRIPTAKLRRSGTNGSPAASRPGHERHMTADCR